jgi:hypothetical protein
VPLNWKEAIPDGYFVLHFTTINGYALLRAIPASAADADQVKAIDLVKKLRLYALTQAENPPL